MKQRESKVASDDSQVSLREFRSFINGLETPYVPASQFLYQSLTDVIAGIIQPCSEMIRNSLCPFKE